MVQSGPRVPAEDEGKLGLDPRLRSAGAVDLTPSPRTCRRAARRSPARRCSTALLHGARGEADLVAAHGPPRLLLERHPGALDRVGVLDGHVRVGERATADLGAPVARPRRAAARCLRRLSRRSLARLQLRRRRRCAAAPMPDTSTSTTSPGFSHPADRSARRHRSAFP